MDDFWFLYNVLERQLQQVLKNEMKSKWVLPIGPSTYLMGINATRACLSSKSKPHQKPRVVVKGIESWAQSKEHKTTWLLQFSYDITVKNLGEDK